MPGQRLRQRWRVLRYRRLLTRLAGPKLVRAFADAYPEAFFIEVGSNDGEHHDHLRPFILSRPWSGVMVEPVPYVFERLRENYGRFERIALENAAIAERDGRMSFYFLADASPEERRRLPDWYDGVGSFSREQLLTHRDEIPDIDRRIMEAEVPSLTFESLCRRHSVERLDLILIDTEGYDFQIIRTIDLDRHRPRLLIYEHFHLGPDDRTACRRHLEGFGYATMEEGFDTFCLRTGDDDALAERWHALRPAVAGVSVHDQVAR
jgi:FkbM family methyltransferase